jgi:hypothetical protein
MGAASSTAKWQSRCCCCDGTAGRAALAAAAAAAAAAAVGGPAAAVSAAAGCAYGRRSHRVPRWEDGAPVQTSRQAANSRQHSMRVLRYPCECLPGSSKVLLATLCEADIASRWLFAVCKGFYTCSLRWGAAAIGRANRVLPCSNVKY